MSRSFMKNNKKFTSTELIIVVITLVILGLAATPFLLNIQHNAKLRVINGVKDATEHANKIAHEQYNQGYAVQIGTTDRYFLDLNQNGLQDINEPILVLGHLDSTSVVTSLNLQGKLLVSESKNTNNDALYIGFANSIDELESSQCYFRYEQATPSTPTPSFTIESSGC
jgi:Tfp pilus assembly protein PilE